MAADAAGDGPGPVAAGARVLSARGVSFLKWSLDVAEAPAGAGPAHKPVVCEAACRPTPRGLSPSHGSRLPSNCCSGAQTGSESESSDGRGPTGDALVALPLRGPLPREADRWRPPHPHVQPTHPCTVPLASSGRDGHSAVPRVRWVGHGALPRRLGGGTPGKFRGSPKGLPKISVPAPSLHKAFTHRKTGPRQTAQTSQVPTAGATTRLVMRQRVGEWSPGKRVGGLAFGRVRTAHCSRFASQNPLVRRATATRLGRGLWGGQSDGPQLVARAPVYLWSGRASVARPGRARWRAPRGTERRGRGAGPSLCVEGPWASELRVSKFWSLVGVPDDPHARVPPPPRQDGSGTPTGSWLA